MKATFYLNSGQTVEIKTTGEFTVMRSHTGHYNNIQWTGDLKGPVPVIWPSSEQVVMLTLE